MSRDAKAVFAFLDEIASDGSCSEYEDYEDEEFDCTENDCDGSALFSPPRSYAFANFATSQPLPIIYYYIIIKICSVASTTAVNSSICKLHNHLKNNVKIL